MTRTIIIKDIHNDDKKEEKKLKKFLENNNWIYEEIIE